MKAIDKAIRICDDKQHISTYKGWNISWDSNSGYFSVSKKGEKFTASNENQAMQEIDRREKPSKKTFTFRAMEEHGGIPTYRNISVEAENEKEAQRIANNMLYKKERLV